MSPDEQDRIDSSNPLSVMRHDERVIFELKRHPIGIFINYIMTGVVLILLAVAVFYLVPSVVAEPNKNQAAAWGGVFFVFFLFLSLVFNFIATVVYWGNRWILTDDSITQITQTGLFRKESSQLGLESLEDVTAEQNGILAKIFNYGTLKAETAGHRSKFVFNFSPKPVEYAQKILEAHEQEAIERAQYGPREDDPAANRPPQAVQSSPAYDPPKDPTGQNNSNGFTSNY